MYEQFYGLKEKPFSLTPDPEFLFLNRDYESALDQILYGIRRREGFTVIVGDVGTGKTTLCWALLGRLEKDLRTALILNPMLTAEDMLRAILQDFGVKKDRGTAAVPPDPAGPPWTQGMTRKELVDELNVFLMERAEEDVFCVLIIDEAQDLSTEVLEQLRLLSNLETSKKKLMQIIFVGQIEFVRKLRSPELRSLNQRISIRYELKPLSARDTASYVVHRLKVAGASRTLGFTPRALKAVYRYSRGYPRLVNIVCDRALLAGFVQQTRTITARLVRKAAAGLNGQQTCRAVRLRIPLPGRAAVALAVALLTLALFFGWRRVQTSEPREPEPLRPQPVSIESPAPKLEPVAPAAMPPAPPAPSEAAQYHVQVHSFLLEEQAASAAQELQGQGFAAVVRTQVRRNGTRWFIVIVGPFSDFDAARGCASDLRKTQHLSPIVIRR